MLPHFRAFVKNNKQMMDVEAVFFGSDRVIVSHPPGVAIQYRFDEVILMLQSSFGFFPIEVKENPELDVEWIHEGDIILVEYKDEITNEDRLAFGVIDYESDGFLIDFPQFGTRTGIPMDQEGCYLVGNCWQPETWEKVGDPKLVDLMLQWRKEIGIV